ncbi:MAG: alpha/beta fold hydrolase [Cytophagaceae bacterium]
MKKFFWVALLTILTLFFGLFLFVFTLAPSLPVDADEIIEERIITGPSNLIKGDTGIVKSGDLEIWYEKIEPKDTVKGTILMIMGLGGDGLEWPLYFIQPFIDSGYCVIRFDNRSTGHSTWIDNQDDEHLFTLEDMAGDAIAVLDKHKVEKAHIIGMSMGGMIGQILAYAYPDRVSSLTSIMSSSYIKDPELPPVRTEMSLTLVAAGLRYGLTGKERGAMRTTIAVRNRLQPNLSTERINVLADKALFNERYRRGFHVNAFRQHNDAIRTSGSRIEKNKNIKVPTLVIHGTEDPLIPVEHGEKTASIISGAEMLAVEGMGHDISPEFTDSMHKRLFDLFKLQ